MIMTHLEAPAGRVARCGEGPDALGCSLWQGSILNVEGEIGAEYDLHVYAAGIGSRGFRSVTFSIAYNDTDGVGMDVLNWSACGDHVQAGPNWPRSGAEIAISFEPDNCQGQDPDLLVPEGLDRGLVPLLTLRVRAWTNDVFYVRGPVAGSLDFTNCEGGTDYMSEIGEAAFGDFWGWDPCDAYLESHACYGGWPGSYCSCCHETKACRPIASYYPWRQCHNEGGTPIGGSCTNCATSASRATWGAIKARFR